jgi:hypothetical protein
MSDSKELVSIPRTRVEDPSYIETYRDVGNTSDRVNSSILIVKKVGERTRFKSALRSLEEARSTTGARQIVGS